MWRFPSTEQLRTLQDVLEDVASEKDACATWLSFLDKRRTIAGWTVVAMFDRLIPSFKITETDKSSFILRHYLFKSPDRDKQSEM